MRRSAVKDGVTRAMERRDGVMEERATKIMDEGQKGNVYMTTQREEGKEVKSGTRVSEDRKTFVIQGTKKTFLHVSH